MKSLSVRRAMAACAVITLLAGCGGAQSQVGASGAMPPAPMFAPLPQAGGPNLYVGDVQPFGYSEVKVFAPNSNTPLRTISDQVVYLSAIGVRAGELYVVNGRDRSTVTVYEKGGTKLLRTINKNVFYPRGLAFGGGSRNLFVLNNFQNSHKSLTVYNATGGGAPLRTITQGLDDPVALATAATGNVYVLNQGPFKLDGNFGSVAVYAASDRPVRKITQGIAKPVALAFDSSDNLYVASANVTRTRGPAVTVYAKGTTKVLRTIIDGVGYDPRAIAIDGSDKLYVAAWVPNAHIAIYAKGASKPLRTITKGLNGPVAMALDASGNLYVANQNGDNVTVYDPKTGALTRTISQGNLYPVSLTFGP